MRQFDDAFSQDAAIQFRRIVEWAQLSVGENLEDREEIYSQVIMEDHADMLASHGLRAFVDTAGGLVAAVRNMLVEQDAKREIIEAELRRKAAEQWRTQRCQRD
jgi:hypothetical protein